MGAMGIPAHLLSVSDRPGSNVRVEASMIERRIKRGDELDGTVVVWDKFECDEGKRWTQVQGPTAMYKDGDPCECPRSGDVGHFAHKRGETSDRDEAVAWSRSGKEPA